ncbi:MAG: excinuclease ABC subunit UvrC [Bacillota bacterium]
MLEGLKEKVSRFPDLTGVYLIKDDADMVIYVGKAASLRKRVRSYLAEAPASSPRLKSLQARLADIDYVVTDTEVEALILECSLIKEYRPRFNVNLKDDKDYPYLILTGDLYPRLEMMRLSQRGSRRGRYRPAPGRKEKRFGPYTDVWAVRETMRLLGSLFPLRRCRMPLDGSPSAERPCLNFQMKRCLAPCRGQAEVAPEQYEKMVNQVILFLQGRYSELEDKLKLQMNEAACEQRFEAAAALRDRLYSLQRIAGQQQKMLLIENSIDRDITALARYDSFTAVHLFQIRDGKMLRQNHFSLSGAEELENEEVMTSFIKNYYSREDDLPAEIVVSDLPADFELIDKWLREKAGRKVKIRMPKRGALKKMVDLAARNCFLRLKEDQEQRKKKTVEPLQSLAELLGLEKPPVRIEGYDISHLRGGEPVGAMIVFVNGEPAKEGYRRFNIRKAPAGDDYAALEETLQRRAARDQWARPDLIMIDGGRGQLNSAFEALYHTSLKDVPLLALAKDPDQIFLKDLPEPVRLASNDSLLHLLQRIRDEVHRFAVSGHRSRRSRSSIGSRLENIPGIGPVRRKALLNYFGSIEKIMQASVEQLEEVSDVNRALAERIYRVLREE